MLPNQRHLFDIPEGVAYLNCAYMSPLMRSVVEAGSAGLARKSRPWEVAAGDFFTQTEEVRGLAARLFHATAEDVALVPSASYGIETAVRNVPVERGQKILVLAEQFPSHVYPWRRLAEEKGAELVTVAWPEDGDWTGAVLRCLTEAVAVAALPHTQWTSGGMLDLERIGAACRGQGTAVVLDLTQSLGAFPFDAGKVQPDFAVAAGYKWLLCPYTTGVLYVAPKWHGGQPLEAGWMQRENGRRFAELIHYTDGYMPGARRFDMGEHANFALVPGMIAALRQILEWGVEEIAETVGGLTGRLVEELGPAAVPEQFRAPHYLCLRRESLPDPAVLGQEGIYVSLRGTSLRVTPHVYNSFEDIARLRAKLV
ncbi:MAG TPA: aminotransferase class V-fold PLP-dependent enzyme [Candidatus Sulfopaludibacter sp.]|jgi:selenocysteine lyase/cysteine desulfurase|nr:aminotransferase class V-fold PLP-dependent enzyme [Candidatus Sulfopaludibacter sp.]